MIVWLLVLLLLISLIYVVYKNIFAKDSSKNAQEIKHHYTFKI